MNIPKQMGNRRERRANPSPSRIVRWSFPSAKFSILHPKHRARHKCLYGGRAGAKSHSAARMALALADTCRMRILCSREIQISIAESMYRLLVNLIEENGLSDRFRVLRDRIENQFTGSTFIFRGLHDVKSMEGVDLAIVEEAQQVSAESMRRLIPTLRKPGAQMWWLWNPDNEDDPVHDYFLGRELPPRTLIQKVNYTDNPSLSVELIEEAEYLKRTDEAMYRHIWLGECRPKGVGWTFINPLWLDHAASGEIVPLSNALMGRGAIGCDPAFQGVDLCCTVYGHGNRIEEIWEQDYSTTGQIAAFLHALMLERGRFTTELGVDCIGTGIGVGHSLVDDYGLGDMLQKLDHKVKEWNSPVHVDFEFDSWRSQAWWQLRCDLEAGNIDLSILSRHQSWQLVKKEILAHQMSVVGGKIRITKKDDLRKAEILGWSPGRADAIVAWNWVRKRKVDFAQTHSDSARRKDYGGGPQHRKPEKSAWL